MLRTILIVLCPLLLLSSAPGVSAQPAPPDPATVLDTLYEPHPRLFLHDDDLARIKALRETDPALDRILRDVVATADGLCEKPPVEYVVIGPRLLSVSRECLRRVWHLGLAWRLTGEEKYARACEKNLLAVCAFKDWNHSHFLDTAEMSNAVGVGYDWLFGWFGDGSRETIRRGLIRHGLEIGIKAYRKENGVPGWWADSRHNWNQVCNGGLIVGALAVAETDPGFARFIVPAAVKSLPLALQTYAPDGAWPEGPGYWHYASRYTAYGLSALETALGTDFGLSDMPGLDVTGFFPILTTGPTGLFVNFADAGERSRRRTMPCLFWFARRFGEPFPADAEHDMIVRHGGLPEHAVWYVPPTGKTDYSPDLDRLFRGPVEVAVFRSAWNDPDALFAGFKAGYNQVNHAHLDLGGFELDALGVRWVRDLGSDDYNLPSYWGMSKDATRWTYYRLNSHSHNVVTLDGENQDVMGESAFTAFGSRGGDAFGVVDLTSAYLPKSTRTHRGLALVGNRRAALVEDEFDLAGDCEIAWGITTDAAIRTDGPTATLGQEGRELVVRILEPPDAAFTVESAEREPPEKRNEGVRRLVIRLHRGECRVRIAVLFSPRWPDGTEVTTAAVRPLSAWK